MEERPLFRISLMVLGVLAVVVPAGLVWAIWQGVEADRHTPQPETGIVPAGASFEEVVRFAPPGTVGVGSVGDLSGLVELAMGDYLLEMSQLPGPLGEKIAEFRKILARIDRVDLFDVCDESGDDRAALIVVKTQASLEEVLSLLETVGPELDSMKTSRPGVYFRPGGSTQRSRPALRIFDGSQCAGLPSEFKLFAIGQALASVELGRLGPENARGLLAASGKLPEASYWAVSAGGAIPVGGLLDLAGSGSQDSSPLEGFLESGSLLKMVPAKHSFFWFRPRQAEGGGRIVLEDQEAAGQVLQALEKMKGLAGRFLQHQPGWPRSNLGRFRCELNQEGNCVLAEIRVPRGILADLLMLTSRAREQARRRIRERGLDLDRPSGA